MTPMFSPSPHKSQRQRAMALVIVLVFVALLSGLVVAYFSRAVFHRRISHSSLHQAKADELARSALDIITGCLKQEIVNGSLATTLGETTLYASSSNADMVPVRNGTPPLASGTYPIPTLLRVSSTQSIAAPGVDFAASNASTTSASANGRSITRARWNQHYLIPRDLTKYSKPTKRGTEPLPAFTAPSWVFVTPKGPAVPALTAPNRSVLGRYAYAIYDEGALLDVNVAGYPTISGNAPASYALKGSLAFADLTVLGISGSTGVNNLVGWRNYASLQPDGALDGNFTFKTGAVSKYVDYVLNNTNGFLQVGGATWNGHTDQAFLSRQELLRFSRATTGMILPQDSLQYLGTFSRAVTMPSWSPAANEGGTANKAVVNLRFPVAAMVTHYNDNGVAATYPVQYGEPFLQRRFSLARLRWLTSDGPATDSSGAKIPTDAIQACFGLQWDDGPRRWKYVGPKGSVLQSSIETLDKVADEPTKREPNLFELLKAGILSESLSSTNTDGQIIQIGANMVDQADADSNRTAICFNISENPEQETVGVFLGLEKTSGTASSPVILDRAFRSVGELGYVHRDANGKTLDFWSAKRADVALLDLFTTNDNEPQVVAGQVNPNNAPAAVLQAIFSGALKNADISNPLTLSGTSDAKKIAAALVAQVSGTSLCNRADLPAALDGALKTAAIPGLANKPYGEAPVRALACVTNTRTWNLMIDVIAQTGVFSPSAKTLDDFTVQGERRYWLHVAIDRFTGKVIDRQLEPVDE